MRPRRCTIFCIIAYVLLIVSPLLILLLGPRPAGRTFWREFSVALGFVGLSLMGLQFIPPARLPIVGEAFPMDALYSFHHRISIVAFLLTLAHPLILFINNPYTLRLLNIFRAPWRARAGVIALLALILLIVTSVRRRGLGIDYDTWHLWHDIFTVLIMGLALYHILNVDYYTAVPLQRGLWIVMAVVWGSMLLYIRVIKPWLLLRRPYRLAEVIEEHANSWSLIFEPVGHAGMNFRAGQVAWLSLGHSPFHIEEHPFSIASSAEKPGRVGFAIKELGDFTARIGDFDVGTRAYIDGPYGTFNLADHEEKMLVLIAGGIGSAPVMSMLRTLADRNAQTPIYFFYGNPSWETIIYREELTQLEEALNLKIVHVLENPPEGWEGESGFITLDIMKRHLADADEDRTYFLCGPLPMIDAVEDALEALGAAQNLVYIERYEMA